MAPVTRPLAIVVGFIARLPVAGMALYNLHYMRGLLELGYDVHYVERLKEPNECYDPAADVFTDDTTCGLRWLRSCLQWLSPPEIPWTLLDRQGRCSGTSPKTLHEAIDRAAFVLTLATPTWFDDLERCEHRAFVDGDPLFTQAAMLDRTTVTAQALAHYPTLFTHWMRQRASDTTVPTAGRRWISAPPVVASSLWDPVPGESHSPITTVMNWRAWGEVEVGGRTYGHKDREFERFIDMPLRTSRRFVLAVGGPAPKSELESKGWILADPLRVTGTIDAYRDFIRQSSADLGIAKHAYVASRCGWFSDRSLCYLASGRPVLHQDTGFTDWLTVDHGVLPFSDPESLLDALARLERDYGRHARAAREVAETHFEARTVVGRMLDAAGFR